MLKVAKFGGSSMADAKQFAKVKAILEADPSRKVIVVSASGKRFKEDNKLTDLLYLCHAHIKYGVACDPIFQMIADRYIEIRNECGIQTDVEGELAVLREKLDNGISQDELVSRGEYFSAKLMADYLGYEFLDATEWLKFSFDGEIDTEKSYELLREKATGRRIVTPGFYGALPDGKIKVLTRGGSDITGALAAAALDADVYENWTDVSGILMVDPRIVQDPQPIERVTFSELRELSHMGAQVLHEGTVFPVREKNIPVNIRNTNCPEHPGTMIMEDCGEPSEEELSRFVTGITGKKNYSIITVGKLGLSAAIGELRAVLEVFENHRISVEYVPSGMDCVSVVVETDSISKCLYSIIHDIRKNLKTDDIRVDENIAIIAVVGRKMANRPGMSGRLFGALGKAGINIRMISQDPNEVDIVVGIDNKDFEKAIQVMYHSFVKKEAKEK